MTDCGTVSITIIFVKIYEKYPQLRFTELHFEGERNTRP
jgi:hypothetical protein